VNAYERKEGMVYLQVKMCDTCLSALRLRLCLHSKWRYVNTLPFLSFRAKKGSQHVTSHAETDYRGFPRKTFGGKHRLM